MAEKDGNGDKGKPGGDGQNQDDYKDGMSLVVKGMQQMNTNFETMLQAVSQQNERMENILTTISSNKGGKGSDNSDDDDNQDLDVEHMSNRELMAHILKQTGAQFQSAIKPLSDMLEQTGSTASNTAAKVEVQQVAAQHKDFWYFQDAMKKIATESPNLSIARIYSIAKAENPDIAEKAAKEIQEKEEKEAAERGETKGEESGVSTFGGFTPTSGKSQISDDGKEGKLDANKAATKAWDTVVPKGSPLATLDEGPPPE